MRLPLKYACADPAFLACMAEAIDNHELVENFDRLYGQHLAKTPTLAGMREFSKFVHDVIYLRLPDDAIESLRGKHPSGEQFENVFHAADSSAQH